MLKNNLTTLLKIHKHRLSCKSQPFFPIKPGCKIVFLLRIKLFFFFLIWGQPICFWNKKYSLIISSIFHPCKMVKRYYTARYLSKPCTVHSLTHLLHESLPTILPIKLTTQSVKENCFWREGKKSRPQSELQNRSLSSFPYIIIAEIVLQHTN